MKGWERFWCPLWINKQEHALDLTSLHNYYPPKQREFLNLISIHLYCVIIVSLHTDGDTRAVNCAVAHRTLSEDGWIQLWKRDCCNVLLPERTTCSCAPALSASPRRMSWMWHQRRKRTTRARRKVKRREMRQKTRWRMSDERLSLSRCSHTQLRTVSNNRSLEE